MTRLVVSILVGVAMVVLFLVFGWPFLIILLALLAWSAIIWGVFFLASRPGPGSKKKAAGLFGAALAVTIISVLVYRNTHKTASEREEMSKEVIKRPLPTPPPSVQSYSFGLKKGLITKPWRVPSKFKGYRVEIWPRSLNIPTIVYTEVEVDTIWRDKRPVFKPAWTYAFLSPEMDDTVYVYLAKPE